MRTVMLFVKELFPAETTPTLHQEKKKKKDKNKTLLLPRYNLSPKTLSFSFLCFTTLGREAVVGTGRSFPAVPGRVMK